VSLSALTAPGLKRVATLAPAAARTMKKQSIGLSKMIREETLGFRHAHLDSRFVCGVPWSRRIHGGERRGV
jgi:hypothetical protein